MKKVLQVLMLIVLISCGPATKEDRAKEQILKYVEENFNDPDSYENIEYSQLIEVKGKDLEKYQFNIADSLTLLMDSTIAYTYGVEDSIKKFHERKMQIEKQQKEFDVAPELVLGYKMSDKARGKNKLGAKVVQTNYYYFDTAMILKAVLNEEQAAKAHYSDIFRKNAYYNLKK